MKMKKKFLLVLIACMIFFSGLTVYANEPISPGIESTSVQKDPVSSFVERLYEYVLNRSADTAGLQAWTDVLKSGKEQGAKVAQGFIESKEFQERHLDNQTYLKILYRTFFDREADTAGLSAWLKVLESGMSRMHVFKGFAESNEFSEICNSFGIIRGTVTLTAPMDQNEGVTKFIVRCYRLCLGRDADETGLNSWCQQILNGSNTAKVAAYGFVFSNEFTNKNLSDTEYIQILYRVFMDREGDAEGIQAWLNVLNEGKSRQHVFNGFADSNEFQEICAEYGIASGSGIPVGEPETGNSNNSNNTGSGNINGNTGHGSGTSAGSGSTVYYTPNGRKYHSTSNCSTLKRSKTIYSTSQESARASGRTPCKVCYR